METLDSAIQKLKNYFKITSINSFEPVYDKHKNSVTIEFELPVKSFVEPSVVKKKFSFEYTILKKKDDEVKFNIRTKRKSNIPFHPFFVIKNYGFLKSDPYAEWVGYAKNETECVDFLKRMIQSLLYNKDYMTIEESVIGNKKALNWYLWEFHAEKNTFPTDSFPTGKGESRAAKKNFQVSTSAQTITRQSIEKKKFEVVPDSTASASNSVSKKKFEIHEEKTFNPAIKRLPILTIKNYLNSTIQRKESSSKIYISSQATAQIFKHIHWGNRDAEASRYEQGGLLLGKVYHDLENDCIFGIVDQAIAGESAFGTTTYLEMTHQTWSEMISKVDHLQSCEESKDLQIIGWYHTHPNNLDVFMSGTDRNTQEKYFNKNWHFAIVLNPQRRIWRAFCGPHSLECSGFFLDDMQFLNTTDDAAETAFTDSLEQQKIGPEEYLKKSSKFSKSIALAVTLIALAIIGFTFMKGWSESKDGKGEQKKTTETKVTAKIEFPTPIKSVSKTVKSDTPANLELESKMLKKGEFIYNNGEKRILSLMLPIKVQSTEIDKKTVAIETDLFVHKDVVRFTPDSVMKAFENLRSAKSSSRSRLVGKLLDTFFIAKNKYQREGNWYKIKFTGLIKQ